MSQSNDLDNTSNDINNNLSRGQNGITHNVASKNNATAATDNLNPYMDNWNYLINSNDMNYMDPNNVILQIQYQQDIHQDDLNQNMYNFDNQEINKDMSLRQDNEAMKYPVTEMQNFDNSNFPANYDMPRPKQRRPCDSCRRRKTKCVTAPGSNNCIQCDSKGIRCTFTTQATKRKLNDDSSAPNKRSNLDAPDVPIRDVPPVQDYSSMNNSLLKKTLSLQFPRSSFYIGPSSHLYDINLMNLIIDDLNRGNELKSNSSDAPLKIEQVNLSNTLSLRKVSDKVQFLLKDDQSPQSYHQMSNDVDTIEKFIAPHGQILIDLYFRIVHPSYPILHKKVFLEKYSRTHREFSAPLLAAVYVLAIQWWDYDPQLNRFPKPNVEAILKIGLNNYLLEIMKRPKLSAVQAGLLLLQCKHTVLLSQSKDILADNVRANNQNPQSNFVTPGIGDTDYSDWVLCSQVVALAEELGLGLDCNTWKLPKWERGLRKRLAWAVYMEDKWLSLKNARPSHINEINWVVRQLVEEDFPEKHGDGDLREGSSDIDNGKKIFMHYIELSKILSDILTQCYSFRAMNELTGVEQVLEIAKPLQFKLRSWYRNLPPELQMNTVQPRKLCSNGYLHLSYFATELTLHRKLFTMIYQQNLGGNAPPKVLTDACRQAARTRLLASIEFVRDLKPEHIHSFWHSSCSANFTLIGTFAAILFMSAPSKEDSDFYRDQIYNYRWILKISAKGFDQVGEALYQLDMIYNKIPGLFNDTELPAENQEFDYSRELSTGAYANPPTQAQAPAQSNPQQYPNSNFMNNNNTTYQSPDIATPNSRVQVNSPTNRTNSHSTQGQSPVDRIKHPSMTQSMNLSPHTHDSPRKVSPRSHTSVNSEE